MQAIVAALCTVLSALAVNFDLEGYKTVDLQLCKDVLVPLELAAENGIEPDHIAAIELCRNLYIRAQNHDR